MDACTQRLSITAPEKMEALEGSCLLIPCNYSTDDTQKDKFDKTREVIGVWMKTRYKDQNVIFISGKENNIHPINIIGNLKENNCTTLFSNLTTKHTDTYFFRIQNEPFKSTAMCDFLQVTVKGKRVCLF